MAEQVGGGGRRFIMEKTLMTSDVDRHQNRLLIPGGQFHGSLRPILTPRELEVVVEEGGLGVKLFLQNRFRFYVQLARWPSSRSVVIKGKEYRVAVVFGSLVEGDLVRMTAYRDENDELCFDLRRVA